MAKIGDGLALALAGSMFLQPAVAQQSKPAAAPPVPVLTAPSKMAGSILREVDDPGSGLRWLLIENPAHPGGPGRLIAIESKEGLYGLAVHAAKIPAPIIHAGEILQVVEHSAVVDGNLEATALSSAAQGGNLRVRLRVGGRIVSARALGPGRAELLPIGERP